MKPAYLLGLAVVTAGSIGFLASGNGDAVGEQAAPVLPASSASDFEVDEPGLSGMVKEVIDVPSYTYLLLATDEGDTWAAVPTTSVQKGDAVEVVEATRMTDFDSPSLDRTFDVIYFGNLSTDDEGELPPGHPPMAGDDMSSSAHGASANGHSSGTAAALDPALADKKVEKAGGDNARRIAEIYSDKTSLRGKRLRVRGLVVKSMPDILGKTFVHIQDGSGDPSAGSHDLTVTTDAAPKPGDIVTVEGKLALDVDIGVGYRYEVVLEDSEILEE